MKCRDFEKLEMKYMDGEPLTEAERAEMTAHTESCDSCRREMEVYSCLKRDLQTLPVPKPREDFTRELMSALKGELSANPAHKSRGLAFLVLCSVISAVSSVAGFLNLALLNRAYIVTALSRNSLLAPLTELINFLAAADRAMCALISAVGEVLCVYGDSLTFGALALAVIGMGIYGAFNKSAIGGINK